MRNPSSLGTIRRGEVFLHIGCEGGVVTLIAALMAGSTGKEVGIGMVPEMLKRAEKNSIQDLVARGILIFGGRTLFTNEDCFTSVVIHVESEEKARTLMAADPRVRKGIIRALLFPYQVLLMGT